MRAKKIIEQEHRSLAAVLHGMLYVVREIRYGGARADFMLLDAMVHYIETFSERFHHPKEEAYAQNASAANNQWTELKIHYTTPDDSHTPPRKKP